MLLPAFDPAPARTVAVAPHAPDVPHPAPVDRLGLERSLRRLDYGWATGRIDVLEDDDLVRSCRFAHRRDRNRLEVSCCIEQVTYRGDASSGRLVYADGRTAWATAAGFPRDIPGWLLRPASAPIWGRPEDDWRVDLGAAVPVAPTRVRAPLRPLRRPGPAGQIEIQLGPGQLTLLDLGRERYVLRELDWEPRPAG